MRIGVVVMAAVALILAAVAEAEDLRTFATPEEAADALVKACAADSREDLVALFGARELALIETSNATEDAQARKRFATLASERLQLVRDAKGRPAGTVMMHVGKQDWPFPVPIVPAGDRWRFDAAAGAQELIDRRIGRNELAALGALRAWLVAQAEYANEDRDGDRVREYAQRLVSTSGRHDGLADEDAAANPSGYRMRILTKQGSHAPGGAHSYIINGNMIAGCALIAWPLDPGKTGLMTFLVSHHGTIYQRDFGADSAAAASRITSFDPGPEWQEVQ